jgi:hypothetical protein
MVNRPIRYGIITQHADEIDVLAAESERAAADTQPIMISNGYMICTRCNGTGEVIDL